MLSFSSQGGEEVICCEGARPLQLKFQQRGGLLLEVGLMEFSDHIKTANVQDVVLRQPLHPPSRGTLCITGHHLLFSDREEGTHRQVLLLLRNIDAIEKR